MGSMYAGTAICWAMVGCADATPGTAATRPTERVVAAASPAAPLAKYLRQGAAVPVGRGHPRWDGGRPSLERGCGPLSSPRPVESNSWECARFVPPRACGFTIWRFGRASEQKLHRSGSSSLSPTDPGRGASIISRLPTHHGQPTAISAEQKTVRDKMADPRALGAAKERNTSHPPRLRRVRKGLSLATRRRVGPCRQPGWRQSTDQPSETTQARKSCWS